MVRIPSLSRRSATTEETRDENRDGRIDERDEQLADSSTQPEPVVTDRDIDQTTYRSRTTDLDGDGHRDGVRTLDGDGHRDGVRTLDGHRADRLDRHPGGADGRADVARDLDTDRTAVPAAGTATIDRSPAPERVPDPETVPVEPAPVGPRPRSSLLATLGLVVGVGAALFVLAGTLAGYGIALGVLGAVLAFGGFSATRRRHIAGRSEALLGLLISVGAVLLGILALSGQYDWPNADADTVPRFREWLDSQFVDRF